MEQEQSSDQSGPWLVDVLRGAAVLHAAVEPPLRAVVRSWMEDLRNVFHLAPPELEDVRTRGARLFPGNQWVEASINNLRSK